jgi:hypothetical protein
MISPTPLARILVPLLIFVCGVSCAPQTSAIAPSIRQAARTSTPILTPPPTEKTPQAVSTSAAITVPAEFNLILGRPSADSITANLYAQADIQISLRYGALPGEPTTETPPINLKANQPQSIELANLQPDTSYTYTVIANGSVTSEHTFHTQRPAGSTFTFTIDADPHNRDPRFNGELYATALTNALSDQPDFHINLGDTFMTEKVKPQTYTEAESTFSEMRPYFGILAADAPLFLVNGNHEGELGWLLSPGKGNDLPIWSTQLRQLYYPGPISNEFYSSGSKPDAQLGSGRDGYYAWTWGDGLFIVLDPFWYTTQKPQSDDRNDNWNWTLGREQYEWLKSVLETSDAKFKFVFIHHLVGGGEEARGGVEFASFFEWGGNNADGSYGFDARRAGWGTPIHQLLVKNQVSAVFHGHDHVFVQQELDGIIYQEVPQPSVAGINNTRLAADYGYLSGVVRGSSGHLRVTVSPAQVTVDYIRACLPQDETKSQRNGQVDYAYVIPGFGNK